VRNGPVEAVDGAWRHRYLSSESLTTCRSSLWADSSTVPLRTRSCEEHLAGGSYGPTPATATVNGCPPGSAVTSARPAVLKVIHSEPRGETRCSPRVEGRPDVEFLHDVSPHSAYFTLDRPATVQLVCGGGEAFVAGPVNVFGRRLNLRDIRLEALRVGAVHDELIPDFLDPGQ
jgi:hypothetical protein